MARQNEFKFEIVEHIVVLRENDKGWKLELTRTSFNGRPPKYDIREWSPDYKYMGKGVTLCDHEAETLAAAIANAYIKKNPEQFGEKAPEWTPEAPQVKAPVEKKQADIVPFRAKRNDPKPLPKPKAETKPKAKAAPKKSNSKINVPAGIELPF